MRTGGQEPDNLNTLLKEINISNNNEYPKKKCGLTSDSYIKLNTNVGTPGAIKNYENK